MASTRPLSNRRVLVTRPKAQAGTLARSLLDAGAQVIRIPAFRVEGIVDPDLATALTPAGGISYDTVVFTSQNAVRYLFEAAEAAGVSASDFAGVEVAAVGMETAAELERRGLGADVVAQPHTAEGLVEALRSRHAGDMTGRRVLYPRATFARAVLRRGLQEMGADVHSFTIYGTVPEDLGEDAAAQLEPSPDAVTFASPSAVVHLESALSGAVAPEIRDRLKTRSATVVIGPVTEKEALGHGYRVVAVATPHTADGMVGALVDYFQKER